MKADAKSMLRAAIERLSKADCGKVSIESDLHSLSVTGGNANRRKAATANPRTVSTSPKKTDKQLDLVAKRARDLHAALIDLNAPGASVFRNLDDLARQVLTIEIIAKHSVPEVVETQPLLLSPQEQLAFQAALVFLRRTGKKPSRITVEGKAGGPFMNFLAEVFAARGVTASVENCARAAEVAMEKSRVK